MGESNNRRHKAARSLFFRLRPGNPTKKKNMGSNEPNRPRQAKMACYLYKRDPFQFADCRKRQFRPDRLSDITNHLKRRHLQPIHCPICGEIFEGDNIHTQRDAHIRLGACERRRVHHPGLTQDQMDALSNAGEIDIGSAATRYEKRWYGRYQALFGPDAPVPSSPYCTDQDTDPAILGSGNNQIILDCIQSFAAEGHLLRLSQSIDPQQPQVLHERFVHLLRNFRQWVVERGQADGGPGSPHIAALLGSQASGPSTWLQTGYQQPSPQPALLGLAHLPANDDNLPDSIDEFLCSNTWGSPTSPML